MAAPRGRARGSTNSAAPLAMLAASAGADPSTLGGVTLLAHWPAGSLTHPREVLAEACAVASESGEVTADGAIRGRVAFEVRGTDASPAGLGQVGDAFLAGRAILRAGLAPEARRVEGSELRLIDESQSLSRATLRTLVPVVAPGALLLLGARGGSGLTVELQGDRVVRIAMRHPGGAATIPPVLPLITGILGTLIRDAARDAVPAALLRFPTLVRWNGGGACIPETLADGRDVLPWGRLTLLRAVGPAGPLWVTAQSALTMLFLHADRLVRRLTTEESFPDFERAVLGSRALPFDGTRVAPRRRTSSALRPAPPQRLPPSPTRRAAAPVIGMIDGSGNEPLTRWLAAAVAARDDARVAVVPWWMVRLRGGLPSVTGHIEVSSPGWDGLEDTYVEALPLDVLYYDGIGGGHPPRSPQERQAAMRLAAAGIARPDRTCRQITYDLLVGAGRGGTVTNVPIEYRRWDAKHGLEFTLRTCERHGAARVDRPTTYVAHGRQAPTVLRRLATRGIDCIIKPSHGGLGRGIVTLCAALPAPSLAAATPYVIQELIPSPLLVNLRKLDVRCHVLIDVDSRERSGWVPPVLGRLSVVNYIRGLEAAENLNYTFQRRTAGHGTIAPLSQMPSIGMPLRRDILDAVRGLSERLVDAYFASLDLPGLSVPSVGPRVFLWGFDVGLSAGARGMGAHLLESNIRPQLWRNAPSADAAMRGLVSGPHMSALLCRLEAQRTRPAAHGTGVAA